MNFRRWCGSHRQLGLWFDPTPHNDLGASWQVQSNHASARTGGSITHFHARMQHKLDSGTTQRTSELRCACLKAREDWFMVE